MVRSGGRLHDGCDQSQHRRVSSLTAFVEVAARRGVRALIDPAAGSAVARDAGARHARAPDVDGDPKRADELARGPRPRFPIARSSRCRARVGRSLRSGVIDATPIGMAKLPGPIDAALLDAKQRFAACVRRRSTRRCSAPRARGCATLDGGGMNVGRAVDAFRLFTGLDADPARVAARSRRYGRRAAA